MSIDEKFELFMKLQAWKKEIQRKYPNMKLEDILKEC